MYGFGWFGKPWFGPNWWLDFRGLLPAGKRRRYILDGEEVELPDFTVPGYEPIELPEELQDFLDDSELDWDDLLKIDEISISPFLDQFQEWAMEQYPQVPQQDLIMAIVRYIVLVDAMMALELMEL